MLSPQSETKKYVLLNRHQSVAQTSLKDVTDGDVDGDDADADSDEYVDTMDRRGGPKRKFIPVRPLPPDVVVPDNLDLPYADLSHLVSAFAICKNAPKKSLV